MPSLHARNTLGLWIAVALLLASCGRSAISAQSTSVASPVAANSGVADRSCATTRAPDPPFIPPPPYNRTAPGDQFWYGTPALWTALPTNGAWLGLHREPDGYTQKVFWWRDGYNWQREPTPQLTVIGMRVDGPAKPLLASSATNAFAEDIGSAMLVGVAASASGCWRITGHYGLADLTFVIWIS
jgi:hypothetical protein